jgi:hypothetical protein
MMTDREHHHGDKTRMDPNKMRRDRVPHQGEVIGKDVPDESKERHTEIAVEVGRKMGEGHDGKH